MLLKHRTWGAAAHGGNVADRCQDFVTSHADERGMFPCIDPLFGPKTDIVSNIVMQRSVRERLRQANECSLMGTQGDAVR